MEAQIVIVGSGIAGLTLAYKLALAQPDLQISIITKDALMEGNTKYAQGGIAAVVNSTQDSFENHIQDTLSSGKGYCIPSVVEMVVKQAPERIAELMEWGIHFDKGLKNQFDLALEGGHSHSRVLHHKDCTGLEVESGLASKIRSNKSITVYEYHSAIDLIMNDNNGIKSCIGLTVLDQISNEVKHVSAQKIILANGGCGQVYAHTTNPKVATGDGYAIAARAGAELRDMRFMQFHPTTLFNSQVTSTAFLISEAVRGFGAHIINSKGERFLFKYDVRGELATRDVISAAIIDQVSHSNDLNVFLDVRHLDLNLFQIKFPTIYTKLVDLGYTMSEDCIPILPAAHYQCGGIVVNKNGETSIKNVYAIGEVSSSGLHGANRLASNSLLEAVVYAHNAAAHLLSQQQSAVETSPKLEKKGSPIKNRNKFLVKEIFEDLRQRMSSSAFQNEPFQLIKDRDHLLNLHLQLEDKLIQNEFSNSHLELRNSLHTALLILQDKIESTSKLNKTEKKLNNEK